MKATIIVASYNYEQYIAGTLDSLISQTYSDWEALVIDDGSSDHSVEIIKSYASRDSRIKLLQHPGGINKGLPATVELGVRHASGEYIAFCESDDEWYPKSLECKIQALDDQPNAALAFTYLELIGEQEAMPRYQQHIERIRNIFIYPGTSIPGRKYFRNNTPVFTFSCAIARANILKQCSFSSPFAPFLDWWLWKQICYNNHFVFVDQVLTKWRIHRKSFLHSVDNQIEQEQFFKRQSDLFLKQQPANYLKLPAQHPQPSLQAKSIGLPFVRIEKKPEYQKLKILGVTVRKSFFIDELNTVLRRAALYRFYSFFPVPGLQRKLKKKYRNLKKEYFELRKKYFWETDSTNAAPPNHY